jgi:hypothetical protein
MSAPLRTYPYDPFADFLPVPRLHQPNAAQWREHLSSGGGPVLLTGALDEVPASGKWTLEYLRARAGHRTVGMEYSARPLYRPDPRLNLGRYFRRKLPFSESLSFLERPAGQGPTHYLSNVDVAEELADLVEDLKVPSFMDAGRFSSFALFAGPTGSGSHMHYDSTEGLMAVFTGRKRTILFPPGPLTRYRATPAIFPLCHFSELDLSRPAVAARAGLPQGYQCTVEAGEMLFIPLHWWHYVRNEGLALGVTFVFEPTLRGWLSWRTLRLRLRGRLDRLLQRWPKLYEWAADRLQHYAFSRAASRG